MTFVALSHSLRPNDLYETEAWSVKVLIRTLRKLSLWRADPIWEPAAGNNQPLPSAVGPRVVTYDIATYTRSHDLLFDFPSKICSDPPLLDHDVIANPPYRSRSCRYHPPA